MSNTEIRLVSSSVADTDVSALTRMPWYYSIELAPGVVTAGGDFPGAALTRNVLRRIGFAGRDCIDIGIQEGLFSVLLARGGARSVEGQDRWPRTAQVNAVQRIYNTPFSFSGGQSLDTFVRMREQSGRLPADVVLFAGVLYHMFDPLAGLCRVRALALTQGIVVVETAVVLHANSNYPALLFNENNNLARGSTYFVPNPAWLDAALRFVGLVPLDCQFLKFSNQHVGRICVPCRAGPLPETVSPNREAWERNFIARDFSEFVNLDKLAYSSKPVEYDQAAVTAVRRHDGSVDVAKSVIEGRSLPMTSRDVTLMLSDRD